MSKNEEDHITDLKETFTNLRKARLELNPEKCLECNFRKRELFMWESHYSEEPYQTFYEMSLLMKNE